MKLAENIRIFRKERSLTQEQLAEVLGVTTGAVYKWEAALSIPELDLIVEMADFFDTSVDVLLGYRMKDNRLKEVVQRLKTYRLNKDRAGLAEAEKALKKYPHAFEVVHECAAMYRNFGIEKGDKELYRRALELLEQSLLLLPQNTDPEINEQILYGEMAEAYLGLDEWEKAIELLKKHNAGGMFCDQIGAVLVGVQHLEEAAPFLSESLIIALGRLINTIISYLNVFMIRGDFASLQEILHWGTELFLGLRKGNKPNYFDKIISVFLATLAFAQWKTGQKDAARESLERAKTLAAFFDASPSYDESNIRFVTGKVGAIGHDSLGITATEGLENSIAEFEDKGFTELWKNLKENNSH